MVSHCHPAGSPLNHDVEAGVGFEERCGADLVRRAGVSVELVIQALVPVATLTSLGEPLCSMGRLRPLSWGLSCLAFVSLLM